MDEARFFAYLSINPKKSFVMKSRVRPLKFRRSFLLLITLLLAVPTAVLGQFFSDPALLSASFPGLEDIQIPSEDFHLLWPTLVDMNGDEKLDLFVNEVYYPGPGSELIRMDYYQNVSDDPASPEFEWKDISSWGIPDDVRFLTFVDIDGDGDPDLFSNTLSLEGDFLFLRNEGNSIEPKF